MPKATDSKAKTLAAAALLFRRQGFHGTALHDILAAAGSPRGSLYFHFPGGKEEIGEAALGLAGERVRAAIAQAADVTDGAETFLVAMVRSMAADLETSEFCNGCPIATTALETAAQSHVLASAARAAFESWEREIARGLVRFGAAPDNAAIAATVILSQLEGALLLSRTYRSIEPLRRAERAMKLLAQIAA